MSNNDEMVRDEFEVWQERRRTASCRVPLPSMWESWRAAHSKYAPRWLPIDEAVKSESWVLVRTLNGHRMLAIWGRSDQQWHDCSWFVVNDVTHYMHIPDAPEVGDGAA